MKVCILSKALIAEALTTNDMVRIRGVRNELAGNVRDRLKKYLTGTNKHKAVSCVDTIIQCIDSEHPEPDSWRS
jgi:hypothetical protein